MNKPFIIAEVGSNFDQSLIKAKKYIDIAKGCNADAVKFQLFSGKYLYPNNYESCFMPTIGPRVFRGIQVHPQKN